MVTHSVKAASHAGRVLFIKDGQVFHQLYRGQCTDEQLRLHLSAIGHPLLGDWLYGTEDRTLIPRPALHSHRLELTPPVTRRRLTVTAPLPEDMARLLPEDMNKS